MERSPFFLLCESGYEKEVFNEERSRRVKSLNVQMFVRFAVFLPPPFDLFHFPDLPRPVLLSSRTVLLS
jgi:hypothetical protein